MSDGLRTRRRRGDKAEPVLLDVVELSRPLPDLPREPADHGRYSQALILIRLHDHVLGTLVLTLPRSGVPASEVADAAWEQLRERIAAHLEEDGLPAVSGVSSSGLPRLEALSCRDDVGPDVQPPLVSVVIPTVGRVERLAECVRSVLATPYPRFEVIVVDNRPEDARTGTMLAAQFPHEPRLRSIREARHGSSLARNAGLAAARGEIVAFTDDDIVVDSEWLPSLVRGFEREPDVGCVTGLVMPEELVTEAQILFERYGGFGKGYVRRVFDLDGNRPDDPLYPYALGQFGTGANMAFPTELLRQLGGFDVRLGLGTLVQGGEDLDAILGVLLAHQKVLYEPDAVVRHPHRRDREGLERQIYRYGVGLSAVLTKHVLSTDTTRWDILRRVPRGIMFAIAPRSSHNAGRGSGYPLKLLLLELTGTASGPVAYLASRTLARLRGHLASGLSAIRHQG